MVALNSSVRGGALRTVIQGALNQADLAGAEQAPVRIGAPRLLGEEYEKRGAALKPFAELGNGLRAESADTKPVVSRVTIGDLRAAYDALPD